MRRTILHCVLMQIIAAGGGCSPSFALKPVTASGKSATKPEVVGYDSNGDGEADFRTVLDDRGVIVALIYGHGETEQRIELADIPADERRHLVLILDGVGYELLREYYRAGHLRYCHPPSRVIAPYPTLTDLSLSDALGTGRSEGFEAEYYDAQAGTLVGGSWAYLRGENMPYNAALDYRADLLTDALGYLFPWFEFKLELAAARRQFRASDKPEFIAYFVTLAGLGTRNGAEGQRRALDMLDKLVLDELWRTRGRLQITIFSDHGHSYTSAKRIPLEEHLEQRGWNIKTSLDDPDDVVYIRFGLETYASFATQRPARLAADLIIAEGVEIASYNEADHVVVLGPGNQQARILSKNGRYAYEPISGDPLKLRELLQPLTFDADGMYAADDLFNATAGHEYPAPLQRIWRAHRGRLAVHTPDVIISLGDAWYSGAKGFAGAVTVESTHGGLNRQNSTTFIMSSAGPLPPLMQSRDIPANMAKLLGAEQWPRKSEQSGMAR